MEIIERRMKERNKVINDAKQYASTLKFRCSAILIGSYSRGDFNLWSDVDILIIGNFSGNPVERINGIDFPPGYEIIPLNIEELNKKLTKNNKFIRDSFRHGVILRDDFNIEVIINKYIQ
jgi:hypothetical protein